MFGWFKKKNKCDKKCCKENNIQVEVHEIKLGKSDETNDNLAEEVLSMMLTPYLDKICDKMGSVKNKSKKEQTKAYEEFTKLLSPKKGDFNPWHVAAVILQNKIINEPDDNKKNNAKKTKSDTRMSSNSKKKIFI